MNVEDLLKEVRSDPARKLIESLIGRKWNVIRFNRQFDALSKKVKDEGVHLKKGNFECVVSTIDNQASLMMESQNGPIYVLYPNRAVMDPEIFYQVYKGFLVVGKK